MERLLDKLESRRAVASVVGLGYVGLPLAVELARGGFRVWGIDIDPQRVSRIESGESYVTDVLDSDLRGVLSQGRLTATTDFTVLKEVDTVSICVPTPLSKTKDPDLSSIAAAVDQVLAHFHPGMLVVLESTTYPGATEELIQSRLETLGWKAGRDFFLCFSPERVDPGNRTYKTRNIPKIVGGTTPVCTRMGTVFYSQVIDRVIPVESAKTAEMVKLLENTFRAVNVGLINEIALMCQRIGIDVWDVIEAAATKPFGFMPFYPGPGIGGHCIPLDPIYLSWKAKTYNFHTRFIDLATDVNSNMPYHVVERIADVLNLDARPLRDSFVLCLGVAYKTGVDDTRESPSLDVIRLLRQRGAVVKYSDPRVPETTIDGRHETSCALTPQLLQSSDCVVLLTHQSEFDYVSIAANAKLVVDTRNAFREAKGQHIIRVGCPLPSVDEWEAMRRRAGTAAGKSAYMEQSSIPEARG